MLVAVALLSLAQAATTQPAPPASPVANAPSEKKTCRREEDLGTIISKRVCHTKAEWSAIDAQNARNAERFSNDRDNSRGLRPGD
jgi:hypothetical protein